MKTFAIPEHPGTPHQSQEVLLFNLIRGFPKVPGISGVFRGDGHRITAYRVLGATGVGRGAPQRPICSKSGLFGPQLRARRNGIGIEAPASFGNRFLQLRKTSGTTGALS